MSGTLLSDLDTAGSINNSDDNAVQRILNDMNGGSAPAPPQVQSNQPMQRQHIPAQQIMNSPNPNSTFQHSIDNVPPTAHMIGNEHPTNADFAAMMYAKQQNQQYGGGGGGGAGGGPYNNWGQAQQQTQQYMPPTNKKNMYGNIFNELKLPIFVSLLFFVLSLPFVNIIITTYFPSFVKGTGELTTFGLLLKSLLAGSSFWILHRIVAPLLTSS